LALYLNGIRLPVQDEVRLKNSAKVAQALEDIWTNKVNKAISGAAVKSAEQVSSGAEVTAPDFERFLVEHWFEIQRQALRVAQAEWEMNANAPRMARQPRTLKDLMELYDRWRRGLWKPRRAVTQGKDLKKRYLDAVQKAWRKHSEDFREGGETTQEEVKREIRKAAKMTSSRAQTIVRTETTRYYNQARRAYYDGSPDVTHYLFMAVRDKATTIWCTSNTVNGKRGRHGLVYSKDDPLLKKETPPCHYNCRSELLPLNRFNPSHQRLINDKSLARRNHQCAPLLPGWND
jgi:SPP1 gp7 family putative phage head morphogenesis protein